MANAIAENLDVYLRNGHLWVLRNGRYWLLRRNGVTKLWKKAPERFRIPVKAGLRATGAIDEATQIGYAIDGNSGHGADFLVSLTDPNTRVSERAKDAASAAYAQEVRKARARR